MRIIPGLGHQYSAEERNATYRCLLQHTRKRPNCFSFVADTDEHLGRNGIRLERDPAMSLTPSFSCCIDGNQVNITSKGSPGLEVNLGKGGLGLEGDIVVYLNGENVYQGPAKEIELSTHPDSH